MPTLVLRHVEQHLVDALQDRARRHGRSAEAEHRAILAGALGASQPATDELLTYLRRGAELGLAEIELGASTSGPVVPPHLD